MRAIATNMSVLCAFVCLHINVLCVVCTGCIVVSTVVYLVLVVTMPGVCSAPSIRVLPHSSAAVMGAVCVETWVCRQIKFDAWCRGLCAGRGGYLPSCGHGNAR